MSVGNDAAVVVEGEVVVVEDEVARTRLPQNAAHGHARKADPSMADPLDPPDQVAALSSGCVH